MAPPAPGRPGQDRRLRADGEASVATTGQQRVTTKARAGRCRRITGAVDRRASRAPHRAIAGTALRRVTAARPPIVGRLRLPIPRRGRAIRLRAHSRRRTTPAGKPEEAAIMLVEAAGMQTKAEDAAGELNPAYSWRLQLAAIE